jgi:hypothetical protein
MVWHFPFSDWDRHKTDLLLIAASSFQLGCLYEYVPDHHRGEPNAINSLQMRELHLIARTFDQR